MSHSPKSTAIATPMNKNTVQQEQQFGANPQGMYVPPPAYVDTDVSAIYVVPADNCMSDSKNLFFANSLQYIAYVPSVTTIPKPSLESLGFYVAS